MSAKKGAKKVDQKKVQKIVEDKTFGMKNKNKSKKVQQYISTVKTQTTQSLAGNKVRPCPNGNKCAATIQLIEINLIAHHFLYIGRVQKPKPGEEVKSKKQIAAEKAAELNLLFKPVVDKKAQVAAGVDPKSVVCQFFKAGTCTKGNRCKFSHDLTKERKAAKIDMYSDRRDGEDGENDTMEDWDENKLREVVDKKHGATNRTDIICKFFLDAIEQKKYGWFWACPNGGKDCMYRHALPPGFVLAAKKKKDEEDEDEDKITLEDQLEQERRALTKSTPLTLELFLKWKEDKRLAKEKAAAERKIQIKAGKTTMSGREAFEFNPDLVAGDDDLAFDEEELRKVQPPFSAHTNKSEGFAH
jgi:hypothetical protein